MRRQLDRGENDHGYASNRHTDWRTGWWRWRGRKLPLASDLSAAADLAYPAWWRRWRWRWRIASGCRLAAASNRRSGSRLPVASCSTGWLASRHLAEPAGRHLAESSRRRELSL